MLLEGLFLISVGLFMKVVLADSMLSATANDVFGKPGKLPALDAWMGVLAFSGQIFFDFSGYSTCAVGAAMCLGFILPQNFLYPYAATGFSDFWKRWHITLSAWLRDYLYIPLGGNRKGKFRTYINLMLTMLLGGLWHGANWTFVVWGGLHGFYLWVEKAIADFRHDKVAAIAATPAGEVGVLGPVPEMLKPKVFRNFMIAMATFFLINVTWVFFRATNFHDAWSVLTAMFGFTKGGEAMLTTLAIYKVIVIVTGMVIVSWIMRDKKVLEVIYKLPWWLVGLFWTIIILLIVWSQESSSSFIYFQF